MEFPVIVEHVRFHADNGFAILGVSLNVDSEKYHENKEDIDKNIQAILGATAKPKPKLSNSEWGYLPEPRSNGLVVSVNSFSKSEDPRGKSYVFCGEFVKHPRYGDQFKADCFYADFPNKKEQLIEFLKRYPFIKTVRSKQIVNKFGVAGTYDVLDNNPEKLLEIDGITDKRLETIVQKWKEDIALRDLYDWLIRNSISTSFANKIYEKWGNDSIEVLEENPYRLTDIRGVGFSTADGIAYKIMKDVPKPYRTAACMQYVLSENTSSGHLYMPYASLKRAVHTLIEETNAVSKRKENAEDYVKLVSDCIKDNLDLFVATKDKNNNVAVYNRYIWKQEKFISHDLFERTQDNSETFQTCTDIDIENSEDDIRRFTGIDLKLDDTQKDAIRSAFENKVTVITGGGGTGKSTICRGIYYLSQLKKMEVLMMSPTGKAAQVLKKKTKCAASTIHRALGIAPGSSLPKEEINADLVLIDEVSMVGVDTMYAVFYALRHNPDAHIVFVGDSNQLPSVSAGNFLSDIMKSECTSVIKLDKIHRQDENSYIAYIAGDISNGKPIDGIPDNASDITWMTSNEDQMAMRLSCFIGEYLENNDIEDIQLIAPKYKGSCGIDSANEIIQMFMSTRNGTQSKFLERNFNKFHIGDRVIQLENNYQKEVFNGDMGTIIDLGKKVIDREKSDDQEDFVVVDFYGDEKIYTSDEINQLKLGWCCSIHKYQGSQSPDILFLLPNSTQRMVSKELIYTAITRAEKHLYMIGSLALFNSAPNRSEIKKRYTSMPALIQERKSGVKVFDVIEKQDEEEED
jgi:exodeoxyribonuclease V alpha subunit